MSDEEIYDLNMELNALMNINRDDKSITPYTDVPVYSWILAEVFCELSDLVDDKNVSYRWIGPIYKTKDTYLCTEYPLGTSCWYVQLAINGDIQYHCAETAALAICKAAVCLMKVFNSFDIAIAPDYFAAPAPEGPS